MSDLSPFGLNDLEAVGREPVTRIKIECNTSAKGEVNVSWSVSLEVPTWDEGEDERATDVTVGRLDKLLATTAMQAAGAKYAYIDHLANRGQVVEPTVTATDLSTAERLFGLTEMDGRPVTSPTQIIDGFDEV
jgi:hypothetical protein